VEVAIRTAMTQLGGSLLQQLLAADTGHCGPRIDCGAGHSAEFVGYRDKRLDTVLGRITLRRAYYHCVQCKRGIAPRDDDLGVTGVSLSPGLRSMTARAAAAEPFATAADLLAELAGIRLTDKRIERSAEADGATAADRIAAESTAIARGTMDVLPAPADRGPAPDKLYIAIDGTGVPMVPAAVTGRAAKTGDGHARTREVKLAALFTQTTTDEQGRPVRDPDSTSYLGSFAPAEKFATLVAAEARRRGADHIRQPIVLPPATPSKRWPTSKPTPTACATATSANTACSSAPASSRPAANQSSANASNYRACAGTSPAPPASSPCAATTPAAAPTRSGYNRTTRRSPSPAPDQPNFKINKC
jgi:hypothetical protein